MRFGVVVDGAASGAEWREKVTRYEAAGFDSLYVQDHVGCFDPFAAAVAAATMTERMRVGTLVLNVGFWNPLLLARAAVTTQLLAGGRFVLGLGAGYAQSEFEQAGLNYLARSERMRRLGAMARALPRLAAEETIDDEELGLRQASVGLVPTTLPLLVGGNGDGVLRVAARYADVVSLVGFTKDAGETESNPSHWSWEGLRDRIGFVRGGTDGRAVPEMHVLVQFASVTDDRAVSVARYFGRHASDQDLDSPFVMVGDEEQVREHITKLAELGVESISVFEDSAETVIPFFRGAQ